MAEIYKVLKNVADQLNKNNLERGGAKVKGKALCYPVSYKLKNLINPGKKEI